MIQAHYLVQINSDDRTETAVAVPDEGYYSGGGFSNYWPTPKLPRVNIKELLQENIHLLTT
jgi:tripeptidyl-peptidase-1